MSLTLLDKYLCEENEPNDAEPELFDPDAIVINTPDRYEIAEYAIYRKAFESFEHREPGDLGRGLGKGRVMA